MEVIALIWKNVHVHCVRHELELAFPHAEIFIGPDLNAVRLRACTVGGVQQKDALMYAHPRVVMLSPFGIKIEALHFSGPFEAKSWEEMELTPVTITADF